MTERRAATPASRKRTWYRSVRAKLVVVFTLVLLAPQLIVVTWLGIENRLSGVMLDNARFAANEAARVLGEASPEAAESRDFRAIEAVARVHRVRIRVATKAGQALLDADHDHAAEASQWLGHFLFGAAAVSPSEFDSTLGPLAARSEFGEAIERGSAAGCRDSEAAELVLCHGVLSLVSHGEALVVYAQDGSTRPIVALGDLRAQLGRLLLATLPFAFACAYWAGERVTKPIEQLSRQALEKSLQARAVPDLEVRGDAEMVNLGHALNTLISKLEERRVAGEVLVADMVHELKNPVATVRACAEALATRAEPEQVARLALLLEKASLRLDTLVSQFLEIAKADAGMLRESRADVDLCALVRGISTAMQGDTRFSGVQFAVEAPEKVLVHGVPSRLDSVVRNLLENAASFAGPTGHVSSVLSLDAGVARLCVRDDGPGITESDLPHVFDRFYSTRGHARGTGLGLALSRAIVEAHEGRVEAHSEPGKGATLIVELPAVHGVFTA